jgi:hypothetical protein
MVTWTLRLCAIIFIAMSFFAAWNGAVEDHRFKVRGEQALVEPIAQYTETRNCWLITDYRGKRYEAGKMGMALRAMASLIEYPWFALVPAGVFSLLFRESKKRFFLVVAILWFAYMAYEYAMKFRILCSGECNIRVDLLLIYPALLLTSLAALVMFALGKSRQR